MNLQEMLTTDDPNTITDEQLKGVAYGLVYGKFDIELQPRQKMLQARLSRIEAAEKAARKPVAPIDLVEAYRDDSADDEYEWS